MIQASTPIDSHVFHRATPQKFVSYVLVKFPPFSHHLVGYSGKPGVRQSR